MSGAPRLRSMNIADSESRPVLGPAGNKAGPLGSRKSASKPLRKIDRSSEEGKVSGEKGSQSSTVTTASSPKSHPANALSMLQRHQQLSQSNLSFNASCSSDASTDSFQSWASTGRLIRSNSVGSRRKPHISKPKSVVSDGVLDFGLESPPPLGLQIKKCAWVTPNSEPLHAAFHDEEWGLPVHDDKKLFELLVLSCALSELTWPAILSKRHIFREVFMDFDPIAVSKMNEKNIVAPGSAASSLLSELKLRSIIENARQLSKLGANDRPHCLFQPDQVIEEFGSFDKYIWSFVNKKPIVSKFRYPRQVPVKTPKADMISKDLVRRGFRSVGPTVVYSFMQVAGITNENLISCFRFQECALASEREDDNNVKDRVEDKKCDDDVGSELFGAIKGLSISEEL